MRPPHHAVLPTFADVAQRFWKLIRFSAVADPSLNRTVRERHDSAVMWASVYKANRRLCRIVAKATEWRKLEQNMHKDGEMLTRR